MNERIVYMDNNATTPIAPEVKEVILQTLDIYGNASSMHGPGRLASAAVSHSRGKVASLIGAQPEEIVFTGGGQIRQGHAGFDSILEVDVLVKIVRGPEVDELDIFA